MTIVELQNSIMAYEARIAELMNGEPTEDNVREATKIGGKLEECRDMLVVEAKRVQDENIRIREEAAAKPQAAKSFIERVLGPKDSFSGIEPGWSTTVNTSYEPDELLNPVKTDTSLPMPAGRPAGVISTLPTAMTDADEHYFQQPAFTNLAAAWTSGNKAESSIEWEEAVASLETIAHWIPIPKMTARRYRSLENTISGSLLLGLELAKDAHVVAGSNSSGIVGIINQPNIIEHTEVNGANLYDTIVAMAAKVRVQSGFSPDCVAMPAGVLAGLKTQKLDGSYLYPEVVQNGTVDGMQIVIDENLIDDSGQTRAFGILVYFSGAAQFNVADPDEITIGLIDKQFIQNSYTLLGEGTYALKVPIPKGFCYCASVTGAIDVDPAGETGETGETGA